MGATGFRRSVDALEDFVAPSDSDTVRLTAYIVAIVLVALGSKILVPGSANL